MANAIASQNINQLDGLGITKLLGTRSYFSIQYNLRQFSWTWVQKCAEDPSEIQHTRTFVFVFVRAKAKIFKTFHFSATNQKTRVCCAQGADDKHWAQDCLNWHCSTMPLSKEIEPSECKNTIGNLNGMDSAELDQYSSKGFPFVVLDWVFKFKLKRNIIVVHTGVLTWQSSNFDWIIGPENTSSRNSDDKNFLIDKFSWSLIIEEGSMIYGDKLNNLVFESPTFP